MMPESLNTFLSTHPYKNMDSLKHVAASLNIRIQRSATADSIREKVLTHAGDNNNIDEEIRNIAKQFKSSKAAAKKQGKPDQTPDDSTHGPSSQIITIDSQQPLFTQEESEKSAEDEDSEDYRESLKRVRDVLAANSEDDLEGADATPDKLNDNVSRPIDDLCNELGDMTHVE